MSDTLKRDICSLRMPGTLLHKVRSILNLEVLSHIRYACCYWTDHLHQVHHLRPDQARLSDGGNVHIFLQKHFLHWLEALSLMENLSSGITMVRTLESILKVSDPVSLCCGY
jgi:hypothetical protein